MKTLVIYHKADFDGIFCREIAKKFLGTVDVEYVGWDYGDSDAIVPPGIERIYMLDISVEAWMGDNRLIWIDHHKSAIEKYPTTIPGYRIDGVAACRLAWQWFTATESNDPISSPPTKEGFVNRDVAEPLAVRLAGEYDIWDKRDPNAELFQHGLRSRELGENVWELMLVDQAVEGGKVDCGTIIVEALLDAGQAIQYAKTQENKSIIEAAGFTIQFEGLCFLACNHARYNSHLFTAGLKPEHDACFGFAWRDGHWNVSLYHAPGKEHHDLVRSP